MWISEVCSLFAFGSRLFLVHGLKSYVVCSYGCAKPIFFACLTLLLLLNVLPSAFSYIVYTLLLLFWLEDWQLMFACKGLLLFYYVRFWPSNISAMLWIASSIVVILIILHFDMHIWYLFLKSYLTVFFQTS